MLSPLLPAGNAHTMSLYSLKHVTGSFHMPVEPVEHHVGNLRIPLSFVQSHIVEY
jgi:hypothetical protein